MSGNHLRHNPALDGMRRLTSRLDAYGDQMNDFARRQMAGEQPDPTEFMRLLEGRAAAKNALQAQFRLHEKPLKTVLNETK